MKPSEIYMEYIDKEKGDGYIDLLKFNKVIDEMAQDIKTLKQFARHADINLLPRVAYRCFEEREWEV